MLGLAFLLFLLGITCCQASSGSSSGRSKATNGGTTVATWNLVKDIFPGSSSSLPDHFLPLDSGKVLFVADNGVNGREPWVAVPPPVAGNSSDISVMLLADIHPNGSSDIRGFVPFPEPGGGATTNKAIFAAYDGTNNPPALWITDGTPEQTHILFPFPNEISDNFFISPRDFTWYKEELYFANGPQLWKLTTETAAAGGTNQQDNDEGNGFLSISTTRSSKEPPAAAVLVRDLQESFNLDSITDMYVFEDYLYVTGDGPFGGGGLIKTDGTSNDGLWTVLAPNITARFRSSGNQPILDGSLYFMERLERQLWRTDGTVENTTAVQPTVIQNINDLFSRAINGKILFTMMDSSVATAPKLYSLDGTTGQVLALNVTFPEGFTLDNGSLNATDLYDENSIFTFPGHIRALPWIGPTNTTEEEGKELLFFHVDGSGAITRGSSLWSTDGTAKHTQPFFEIAQGGGYDVLALAHFQQFLLRTSFPDTIWISDGTTEGTVKVVEMDTVDHDNDKIPLDADGNTMGILGNDILFFSGYGGTATGLELLQTTFPTPILVPPGPPSSTLAGSGGDANAEQEEDESSTTANPAEGEEDPSSADGGADWKLVNDIFPGERGSGPEHFLVLDSGNLLFVADDGVHGRELWGAFVTTTTTTTASSSSKRTVSTQASNISLSIEARMIKDIRPDGIRSDIGDLVPFQGKVVFTASAQDREGVGSNPLRRALWVTDGSEANTQILFEFPFEIAFGSIFIKNHVIFNDELYFSYRAQLWKLSGTEVGTSAAILFLDLSDMVGEIRDICIFKDYLYIAGVYGVNAVDGYLIRTDGTGTQNEPMVLAQNISARFRRHVQPELDGNMYFIDRLERQLWRTDGTPENTVAIEPEKFNDVRVIFPSAVNGKILFSVGRENPILLATEDGNTAVPLNLTFPEGYTFDNGKLNASDLYSTYIESPDFDDGPIFTFPGRIMPLPLIVSDSSGIVESLAFHVDGSGYITLGSSLWITDGSPENTRQFFEIERGGGNDALALPNDKQFLLRTYFPDIIWISDGTREGTQKVVEMDNVDGDLDRIPFYADGDSMGVLLNDILLFSGYGGNGIGLELLRTTMPFSLLPPPTAADEEDSSSQQVAINSEPAVTSNLPERETDERDSPSPTTSDSSPAADEGTTEADSESGTTHHVTVSSSAKKLVFLPDSKGHLSSASFLFSGLVSIASFFTF
jgi:hypothetical protein